MRSTGRIITNLIAMLALGCSITALARSKAAPPDNMAVIVGEAGEQYPITGTGGIKVSGGHHGFFMSNTKSSAVEIDGSGIKMQSFIPVPVTGDFTAAGGAAYFVAAKCVCTFPPAQSCPGSEVVVVNSGDASDAMSITYQAASGERIIYAAQQAQGPNAINGKVDRFITDGRNWYHE